jgi:hypothetical protein
MHGQADVLRDRIRWAALKRATDLWPFIDLGAHDDAIACARRLEKALRATPVWGEMEEAALLLAASAA